MNTPSCRNCPVFAHCNETTGCIVEAERSIAATYDKFAAAAAVAAVEAAEQKLMELVCLLQVATNNFDRFKEGGDLKAKAGQRMMKYSIEVRLARKDYAQAVLNAYGAGMTTNGQILWS